MRTSHRPLGELLVTTGCIRQDQLEAALVYKKANGCKLGQALTALNLLSEEELANALRKQGKLLCVNLRPEIVDREVAALLGEEVSREKRCLAINRIGGVTTVAMEDPADFHAADDLAFRLKTPVHAVHAEPQKIIECIDVVFGQSKSKDAFQDLMSLADDLVSTVDLEVQTDDSGDSDEDLRQPVINMIRKVMEDAFVSRASDIHLEPRRDSFVIRFRVDGKLYERLSLPRAWARPCLARIKVIAKLDIAQRRLPQDGRAQIEVNGKRVDLRVATTPTMFEEGAVIRILDGGRESPSLDKLDIDPSQLVRFEQAIDCRDGFILATGPTGSGKTTTLYAALARLNRPENKIITIEDPVENQVETITQINAMPKIGLTFATGLRSVLRQDPDIVLVGEIRDEETAEIALQAAMTGHLVLSTLHTVGAAETITRLQDMGIEKYLLADTLRCIVSQRLARRICTFCKEPATPEPDVLRLLEIEYMSESTFYAGKGCDRCMGSGFRGRIGLYEILQMTTDLCQLVRTGGSTKELNEAARDGGLMLMREDGVRKALEGKTTLSEVLSITARA